jgi:hypothetical protein
MVIGVAVASIIYCGVLTVASKDCALQRESFRHAHRASEHLRRANAAELRVEVFPVEGGPDFFVELLESGPYTRSLTVST